MSTSPDPAPGQDDVRVVVLAAADDLSARALAGRLGAAVVVTPRDLSQPGWTYVPDPAGRTGSARNVSFRADRLAAVVTRLTVVLPTDLPHVRREHREYVAAEQTAFLRAWLTGLECLVVNAPTSTCLFGPLLTPHEWARLCSRLAIPARPTRSAVPTGGWLPEPASGPRVTVWRGNAACDQECPAALTDRAAQLSSALGVTWLAVTFDSADADAGVALVDSWPDVDAPALTDGLVRYVLEGAPA